MSCVSSVVGGNTTVMFQSSLFTEMSASGHRLDEDLSEEAVHAGQTSVFAGQGGLDVFV